MRDIKDIKIGEYKLTKILEMHQHWIKEDCIGWEDMRADLRRADLSEVDLSDVNLSKANLSGANLTKANLRRANLHRANLALANLFEADLTGANLSNINLRSADLSETFLFNVNIRRADLFEANLTRADLSEADLSKTNLYKANFFRVNLFGANLYEADLTKADLSGANLYRANLYGANFSETRNIPYIPLVCPSDGAFTGWKKIMHFLIKLYIPSSAKRCSGTTNKCRCDKAKVLGIYNLDGSKAIINKIVNINNGYTNCIYEVGKMVYPDSFDDNRWNECSHGIHFFVNKQDAIDY